MVDMKIIPEDQLEAIQRSWAVLDSTLVWARNTARGKKIGDPVGFSSRKSGHRNVVLWHKGKLYSYVYARIIWFLHYGVMPDGEIDHINCDPIDDRIENLRVVTREQNLWNTQKSRTGETKHGYYQDKRTGKYHVQVQCNGKVHGIYGLATQEDARIAREKLASQLHGEYAR
jgi:hypothetical protein